MRLLLRAPLAHRSELAAALVTLRAVRSARKDAAGLQIVMDPPDLAG